MSINDGAEDTFIEGMQFISNGQTTNSPVLQTAQVDGVIEDCNIYDTNTGQTEGTVVTSNPTDVDLRNPTIKMQPPRSTTTGHERDGTMSSPAGLSAAPT